MPPIRTFAARAAACLATALATLALPAAAGQQQHDHHQHDHHQHATEHRQHQQVEASPGYSRQAARYRIPDLALVRADGTTARFPQELDDGRPVVLNFIYTSCTAICPILSHSFAEFQRKLGPEREQVRMVSISIDPEEDTPRRLAEYAARFDAGRQWSFYTGTLAASVSLQKAFQAHYGGKMHHRPVTYLRAAPGEPWVRLDGFTSPDELLAEYRRLVHRH